MTSVWETRDLPVLKAIVDFEDETGQYARLDTLAQRTGHDDALLQAALRALNNEQPRLISVIDVSSMSGKFFMGAGDATGEARRRVGQWPTRESLADRIIAALEDAAENAPTEEERSGARKFLDGAKGVGKGVLTSVLVKVLTEGL
ncbi:MAG: hypothetical protein QOI54_2007 [Actinomycetota bacterium]|jgi:hypothetical protein|nr:hypothetical protein [Actinomycetota bacterium]